MPVIPYDRARLESVELTPFRAVIAAGVASIMTSHIVFPALDGVYPATLSEKVLKGLLRGEMGYDGLVITDCLQMSAIVENFGVGRAAVLAVQAGADILLASHERDFQREVRDAIVRAVETGVISEERIGESVARIQAAKKRFNLESRRVVDMDAIGTWIGRPEITDLEREIAEKAVTVVRNEDGLLPLCMNGGDKVAVVGMHPATELFAAAVREHNPGAKYLQIDASPTTEQLSQVDALIKESNAVVVTTCPREPWTKGLVDEDAQTELVNRIIASGVPTVVVAAREPYGLRRFPSARTSVVTYGYPQVSVRAAVDMIFGRVEPHGKLPVTLPGYAETEPRREHCD